jgi:hypothetical protein
MWRGAVLEQKYALPYAELQTAVGDRDCQLGLGEHALDVRRHIVRPLVIVPIEGHVFGNQPAQKSIEVVPHRG